MLPIGLEKQLVIKILTCVANLRIIMSIVLYKIITRQLWSFAGQGNLASCP